jgi:30S ribosomal protein S31
MGKGDRRSRKGKIFRASFGNSRPHKVKKKKAGAAATAAPEGGEAKKKAPAQKKKAE